MKIEFEFDDTFVASIRKSELLVDVTKLHANAYPELFEYGLQRILNDATGASGKLDAVDKKTGKALYMSEKDWRTAIDSAAQKKLDQLYSGDFTRTRTVVADPVKVEAFPMIAKVLRASLGAAKVKTMAKEDFIARVRAEFDRNADHWTAKAHRAISERAEDVKMLAGLIPKA